MLAKTRFEIFADVIVDGKKRKARGLRLNSVPGNERVFILKKEIAYGESGYDRILYVYFLCDGTVMRYRTDAKRNTLESAFEVLDATV